MKKQPLLEIKYVAPSTLVLNPENPRINEQAIEHHELLKREDAKLYNLGDNKLGELAQWDIPGLDAILAELQALDIDVSIAGFGDYEFSTDIEGNTDPDDVPEVPEEPVTKKGDLWLLGNHRLLCGDSTVATDVERLMDGKKADMVFTDPPYGIDYSGGRTQVVAKKAYGKIKGDKDKDITCFIDAIIKQAGNKDFYICLSPINFKDAIIFMPKYEGIIVWKKQSPGLGYQWVRRYCEYIIFNTERIKKKTDESLFDFWDISTDPRKDYQHGTQKPVEVPSRAIRFSSVPGDNVLDLFSGSGTTIIAAEKTGRICMAMEIDEHYCDVSVIRWQNFTGKQAVREGDGVLFDDLKGEKVET